MNGVWVDPVPNLIIGDLKVFAETASVTSTRIPGYWTHKLGSVVEVASPPQAGEKLIYFLHGGGYTQLSAHPTDVPAAIPRGLLKSINSVHRVFAVEYRLSSGEPPANPFPAALLDAVAGYNYLVNVIGFAPLDIIICGDSAGGNLALALTRYLVENQTSSEVRLPAPPAGIILLAPWSDLSDFYEQPGSSMFSNERSDFLDNSENYVNRKKTFLGPHGLEAGETNRYVSPAYPKLEVNFIGFPRTFISAGGGEMLLDQIKALHQRMVKDLGAGDGVGHNEGKVKYLEAPDSVHDFLLFDWQEPERSSTLEAIADWVSKA